MRKRKTKAEPKPKQNQAWFERKVAELKTALEKLPADRQEELKEELKRDLEEKG
jgi:hypothetical protein